MILDIAQDLLTVADYERMITEGRLTENDRVELIEGRIVPMSPKGTHHAACVTRLNRILSQQAGAQFIVRIQDPIRLKTSEPEPDVVLAQWQDDVYESGHPKPGDILLLIEVSDSTLADDRNVKCILYAQAGIPEYWIVNLPGQAVEIYIAPQDGVYQQLDVRRPGETLTATTLPGLTLQVSDIL